MNMIISSSWTYSSLSTPLLFPEFALGMGTASKDLVDGICRGHSSVRINTSELF